MCIDYIHIYGKIKETSDITFWIIPTLRPRLEACGGTPEFVPAALPPAKILLSGMANTVPLRKFGANGLAKCCFR